MALYARRLRADARLLGFGKLVASLAIAFTLLLPGMPSLAAATSPYSKISESASHRVSPVHVPQTRAATVLAQNAPAAAATSVAQTGSAAQNTASGIPWWAWLIIALVILGIIFGLMRRNKEPAIQDQQHRPRRRSQHTNPSVMACTICAGDSRHSRKGIYATSH